jgi:hypothetical protein
MCICGMCAQEAIEALKPIVESADTTEMVQRRRAILLCLRTAFKKNVYVLLLHHTCSFRNAYPYFNDILVIHASKLRSPFQARVK